MAFRAALRRLRVPRPNPVLSASFAAFRISDLHQRSPLVSRYRVWCIHSEAKAASTNQLKEGVHSLHTWKIKMLYDGECPLCMREVNMLLKRNKRYGAIKFVDISSKDYSPEENEGIDYKTAMGSIHAILSDGTVFRSVDPLYPTVVEQDKTVFIRKNGVVENGNYPKHWKANRRLYEEVGLGWVFAITKYEPMATITNAIYGIWAKYRLQVTGRPSLENILESRNKKMDEACSDKVCKM